MGITKLWDVINEKDSLIRDVPISELATEHICRTGRPYRIAVDAAYWHWKNVNKSQTETIRAVSQRASNPEEKAVLYRVLRYAKLGIQLVFVFDGPKRPRGKRGSNHTYTSSDWDSALLKETLAQLGVPCWYAPGEAEAEAAALQSNGHVDAVFSPDGDSFMFGAQTILMFKKEARGSKSNDMVRIVRAQDVKREYPGLDRAGVALFALLTGCDYSTGGLFRCGSVAALEAVQADFGKSLLAAYRDTVQRDVSLQSWRDALQRHFADKGRPIAVPNSWPETNALNSCLDPIITSSEHKAHMGRDDFWCRSLNLESLRQLFIERYNFSVENFLTWFPPVMLVRRLMDTNRDISTLDIEVGNKVSWKEFGSAAVSRVEFDIEVLCGKEFLFEWSRYRKNTKAISQIKVYEHKRKVICEVPDCILQQRGLDVALEGTNGTKRKREAGKSTFTKAKKKKLLSNETRLDLDHLETSKHRSGQRSPLPQSVKEVVDIDDIDHADEASHDERNKHEPSQAKRAKSSSAATTTNPVQTGNQSYALWSFDASYGSEEEDIVSLPEMTSLLASVFADPIASRTGWSPRQLPPTPAIYDDEYDPEWELAKQIGIVAPDTAPANDARKPLSIVSTNTMIPAKQLSKAASSGETGTKNTPIDLTID